MNIMHFLWFRPLFEPTLHRIMVGSAHFVNNFTTIRSPVVGAENVVDAEVHAVLLEGISWSSSGGRIAVGEPLLHLMMRVRYG